jgi:uncharacterized protein
MPGHPTDHSGLEMLPLERCLQLLASVPVGRIGFHTDGEVTVLPVNHVVDGQDVIFCTARGSKLTAAEAQGLVAFEADDYDAQTRTGWSVVVNGYAEVVYEDNDIRRFEGLGLHPWADGVERSFWVRIRPTSVTGRLIPAQGPAHSREVPMPRERARIVGHDAGRTGPQVFDVLRRGASQISSSPFGDVGTVFSGHGLELVWVSKLGDHVDEHWFSSHEVDVLLVLQGQLKLEFESQAEPDRVLGVGEALVLPAGTRCRAYRWPRDAKQATIFVAAYPVTQPSTARQARSTAGT